MSALPIASPRLTVLPGLDPARYARHALHAEDCVWVEKNCYIDLWIELLHAQGLDPHAMLPFVLTIDFEGDQCTFFKPPLDELRTLYGVDVQELTVWRPLIEHAIEHLSAGKLISTEADAFWLPDTAGTDYRNKHTKTTIVLTDLDVQAQRLGYFHNAGYYSLEGEDFVQTFRLDKAPDPTFMPLFAELVRVDRMVHRTSDELAALSTELLRKHFAWRPARNPILRFGERLAADLPMLQERGLDYYHAWAFGTIRQFGAAFELATRHLGWLQGITGVDHSTAIDAFGQIASGNKALILKVARAVNARRAFDGTAAFAEMGAAWQRGMDALAARL